MSAAAAIIAGGTITAIARHRQGKALQRVFNAQAAREDINAERALEKGIFDANQIRRTGERIAGVQRAAVGGSGVQSSGTLLNVFVDQAIETDFEARVAIFNSEIESGDASARADILRQQGVAAKEGADAGAIAGAVGTFGRTFQ